MSTNYGSLQMHIHIHDMLFTNPIAFPCNKQHFMHYIFRVLSYYFTTLGVLVGDWTNAVHGISGSVKFPNPTAVELINFVYDGSGPGKCHTTIKINTQLYFSPLFTKSKAVVTIFLNWVEGCYFFFLLRNTRQLVHGNFLLVVCIQGLQFLTGEKIEVLL